MTQSSFQQYQSQFTAHIRDPRHASRPAGVPSRGMRVYGEIVFNNMDETLSACFPVCKKIIGVRRWKSLIRDFIAQHRCATPWFRQIPEEFLLWLNNAPPSTHDLPIYLYSLAHYEWIELAIGVSDAKLELACDAEGDLLHGRPVLAPALALLEYDYPVHRISPKFKPDDPSAPPVHLLVFRNLQDEVKFIELNRVSARLIALLQYNQLSGMQAIETIAAEIQASDLSAMVDFGTELLKRLHQNNVILGIVI